MALNFRGNVIKHYKLISFICMGGEIVGCMV